MIDQIKPKNLGTDLNNNKVTSESVTNKVSDAKVSKVSHLTTDVESNNGKVSQFISKEKVKKMASEPPIDKTAVTRIKAAIASGTYPLDLEKLADALIQVHKEIK
tara:strand:- start:1251 stop:1565 length:315 start_codon:yes stop_codon:yes gene_type:complete